MRTIFFGGVLLIAAGLGCVGGDRESSLITPSAPSPVTDGVAFSRSVHVPPGATYVVDKDANDNFSVQGTLVVLEGRRINGNIELVSGTLDVRPEGRISGNIIANATVVLAGARVEGNIIYESAGRLDFPTGLTIVWGNLEFKAPTTVSGSGDVTIHGNVRCQSNIVDNYIGRVVTTGNAEGCPSTLIANES